LEDNFMKLIVTIPAYNEETSIASVIHEIPRKINGISEVKILVSDDGSKDKTVEVAKTAGADLIISHKENKGLAATFKDAIGEALLRGADIVVNVDADGQHDTTKIPDLIKPILDNKADIVVANRNLTNQKSTSAFKRFGNILGDFFLNQLVDLPGLDVSCGFRAYNKEAALYLNVLSSHTYTHETLIQAKDHRLIIKGVDIPARKAKRKSKLIKSIAKHISKSLLVIFRIFTLYKPLRVMSVISIIFFLIGLFFVGRYLFFYFSGVGGAHIQSLLLATVLIIVAFQVEVLGLLASAIGWNRKLIEEILYRIKKIENENTLYNKNLSPTSRWNGKIKLPDNHKTV
jgi:glycosyltransferase involved in cell wall biosynthesis